MAHIFITAGIFLLILVSLFLVLVVLMQRANTDGGMGAAFGGGITESAFGTEAGNVMTKITRITFVAFAGLAFVLYLAIIAQQNSNADEQTESLFDEKVAAEVAEESAAATEGTTTDATSEAVTTEETTAPAAEDQAPTEGAK